VAFNGGAPLFNGTPKTTRLVEPGGVSAATVRRRLSIVSGFSSGHSVP